MTDENGYIGRTIGNYRIIRQLGRGGFAEVYLGEHTYLNTPVAVKMLHTRIASEELEAFLKEARTVARLLHPHIVRVTDFGVEGETPFLVMDYAPNGTLRQQHIKGTRLPLATIVKYVRQIADALQYAHDEKFIHRDIKPENMLLGRRNEVLLSDFGLALVAQSSRSQSTQDVVGTIAYMSPEQIQGKPRPASDQYSLGVVVYEWLCGERPFRGSFTELCTQHMFASPQPLRKKGLAIPFAVEQAVLTALAKDPKQRFINVQTFADALEQASQLKETTVTLETASLDPSQAELAEVQPSPTMQSDVESSPFKTILHSSGSYSTVEVKLATEPPDEKPIDSGNRDRKGKVWSIGRPQIVTIVLGAVLFGVLSHLLIVFPGLGFIEILPAILILLFFGVVFGPWVGFLTGSFGYLIGFSMSSLGFKWYWNLGNVHASSLQSVFWNYDVGIALIGFIAGLAILKTKGFYNNARSIATADFIGAIGSVVGLGFLTYSYIVILNLPYNTLAQATGQFIHLALPTMTFGLILLPILLFGYNTMVERRRR